MAKMLRSRKQGSLRGSFFDGTETNWHWEFVLVSKIRSLQRNGILKIKPLTSREDRMFLYVITISEQYKKVSINQHDDNL